jgi:hypothetical protein
MPNGYGALTAVAFHLVLFAIAGITGRGIAFEAGALF